MKDISQRILDYLLEYAPVNILYRVKKEILNESVNSTEMHALQEKICALPKVKKAFSCQNAYGFFGTTLHGVYFDGFDSTVELLKKNGVELTNPHLQNAKEALLDWNDYKNDHFYHAGNAMDEHGRGGFRAIWAEQLLELGVDESHPMIREQIENALCAFRGAMEYTSPDDFSKKATFRGQSCRYYINGAPFPAANHIKMLERTLSWRTDETLAMVRRSYANCKNVMQGYSDGVIYINCGHFVGPFNYHWNQDYHRITVREFDDCPINFAWFMKGLGSASKTYPVFDDGNPYLAESLTAMLENPNFIVSISEEQLRMIKNYASMAPSWRKKEHIACDLYFPILLALHKMGET